MPPWLAHVEAAVGGAKVEGSGDSEEPGLAGGCFTITSPLQLPALCQCWSVCAGCRVGIGCETAPQCQVVMTNKTTKTRATAVVSMPMQKGREDGSVNVKYMLECMHVYFYNRCSSKYD